MTKIEKVFVLLSALLLSSCAVTENLVKDLERGLSQNKPGSANPALTEQTIILGLKQALEQGVNKSIAKLGRINGFLGDKQVRIPMPKTLRDIDSGLRKIGQGKTADEFIQTMNRAAEKAVPGTVNILVNAVKSMTLVEAGNILRGKPDAATQYFRRKSINSLRSLIKPVVQKATNAVGLTRSYKEMINNAGFLAQFFDKDSLDIDQYITEKAIDGIFLKMADEEKRIRENPVARTTEIMKQVFQ